MAENIYVKLAKMRVELQKMNIKKSGWNDYSKYNYYELADILPPINELQEKYKTCSIIYFKSEEAVMVLINAENPDERVEFTSPMADLTLKAAHAIQNLGGIETYQRRYLYMTAFEIVENDYFDATQGKEDKQGKKKKEEEKPKKAQPKQQKNMAIDRQFANSLNLKIKEYSARANVPIQDVTQQLKSAIGKPLSDISPNDAQLVLALLNQWLEELNNGGNE